MQTYARQGGTSTIFINDDGLRLLSVEERDARIIFYANHGIGWVARPKHDDSSPAGFKRAGRFKKASNMNYALALSLKAEKHLADLLARERAHPRPSTDGMPSSSPRAGAGAGEVRYGMQYRNHDGEDQGGINRGQGQRVRVRSRAGSESGSHLSADASYYDDLEEKALQMAIDEVYEASGRRFRPWAANGRACRLGEIVLLVDSDTVVPEDCLRDAAREMAECPTVAIVQHESDVMQVAHHYFENGMAYFTRRIHKCISLGKLWFSVSTGARVLGHGHVSDARQCGRCGERRGRAFRRPQRVPAVESAAGCRLYRPGGWSGENLVRVKCVGRLRHCASFATAWVHHPMGNVLERWFQGRGLAHRRRRT